MNIKKMTSAYKHYIIAVYIYHMGITIATQVYLHIQNLMRIQVPLKCIVYMYIYVRTKLIYKNI